MQVNVYINNQNVGKIECPKCKKLWEKDFSQLNNINGKNVLKCKCPCGHSFTIKLERRRHYRKLTTLTGSYMHDKTKKRGLVNIKNLSKSGANLELNTQQMIPKGDKLVLKFNLDDAKKSYMCKEAVVKKADGTTVGLEFCDTEDNPGFESYCKE